MGYRGNGRVMDMESSREEVHGVTSVEWKGGVSFQRHMPYICDCSLIQNT